MSQSQDITNKLREIAQRLSYNESPREAWAKTQLLEMSRALEGVEAAPAVDSEGWISHSPGECPVHDDQWVAVRMGDSQTAWVSRAGKVGGWFREDEQRVTHYKLLQN